MINVKDYRWYNICSYEIRTEKVYFILFIYIFIYLLITYFFMSHIKFVKKKKG